MKKTDWILLELLKKAKAKGVCIHLPADSVIADKFANDANISSSLSTNIPDGWMGLDIGTMACDNFVKVIHNSKTILWNGPMGVFEMDCFQHGTKVNCRQQLQKLPQTVLFHWWRWR